MVGSRLFRLGLAAMLATGLVRPSTVPLDHAPAGFVEAYPSTTAALDAAGAPYSHWALAWLGYDPPDGLFTAATPAVARRGADQLGHHLRTLAGRLPASRITLVGHSYGALVVGLAAMDARRRSPTWSPSAVWASARNTPIVRRLPCAAAAGRLDRPRRIPAARRANPRGSRRSGAVWCDRHGPRPTGRHGQRGTGPMSGRHIAHWPVRDPLVDGLRAFAVAAVVLGHWLVTGLVLDEEGALNLASPLTAMPALAPASWVLQTLGLFFFAAGHASARSADRHPGVGWVRHRLRRLLLPAVALLGTGSAVLLAAAVAGVADDTLSVALTLAISPLWFLAPLLALVVLTGPLRAAVRRWGTPRCASPQLLGLAHADAAEPTARRPLAGLHGGGRTGRRTRPRLSGKRGRVPGEGRSNLDPPSLLVVALAVTQTGLGLLARPTLVRLLSRPLPRRLTGEINRHAVRVYLWHQPVLVAVVVLAAHGGTALPGLHTVPDDSRWLLARIGWLPVLTAVLVLLVRRGAPAGDAVVDR